MIVKHTTSGWELIRQSDHGRLALRIAEQFTVLNSLPYREQTLKAIARHDDDKLEMNRGGTTYVTSWGTPSDFTFVAMDDPIREIEVCRRLQASYSQHIWIGLLASRHAEHLYRGQAITDSLQSVLDSECANRHLKLEQLQSTAEELERAYDVMRFCDRCSLILCQDRVPQIGRRLEITTMTGGTTYFISKTDDNIDVDPWPFSSKQFNASVKTTLLRQPTFNDVEELERSIDDAITTRRSINLQTKPESTGE